MERDRRRSRQPPARPGDGERVMRSRVKIQFPGQSRGLTVPDMSGHINTFQEKLHENPFDRGSFEPHCFDSRGTGVGAGLAAGVGPDFG